MKFPDDGLSSPWLRSPRLKRGDALLTLLTVSTIVGVVMLVISSITKVGPTDGAVILWGAMFGGCLVAYSGKRLSIKAGPVQISSSEDRDDLDVGESGG